MIKPIPTRYAGYLFRSRLEARWAVFFQVLGLRWQYEVEGLDLDGVHYLPDFKITSRNGRLVQWVEVKPDDGSPPDNKFTALDRACDTIANVSAVRV